MAFLIVDQGFDPAFHQVFELYLACDHLAGLQLT